MENTKNQVVRSFVRIIDHIADKEYQKRAWIQGEPPGTDYDETINLYSEIGDPLLENHKNFGITEDQYQVMKKFREKFEAFWEENHWPPDFIDTPEWDEIVSMAKEVLAAFNYEK